MADDSEDDSSKTEDPSARKLEEARKKGEVVSSKELNHWFMILAATIFVGLLAGPFSSHFMINLQDYISRPEQIDISTPAALGAVLIGLLKTVLLALAIPFLLLLIGAAAGSLLQVGPMWAPEHLMPKLERISIIQGAQRLFSKRSVLEFLKGLLKLTIVGVIVVVLSMPAMPTIEHMADISLPLLLQELQTLSLKVLGGVLAIMLVIAIIDYILQRLMFMMKMRMSRSELKEEYKQSEGDPQIKQRIRQIRMERARARMMANVPGADVVVTNPEHFAVALKYDQAVNPAPVVVAKGADLIAQKIKEVARENEVPIVENPPLARALFATTDIDQPVPFEHWKAVAEVISYVYKLKNRGFTPR